MIDEEITGRIISAFYKVHNTLGHGFIERLYHNPMILEIVQHGLSVEVEKPIAVYYGPNEYNRRLGIKCDESILRSLLMNDPSRSV